MSHDLAAETHAVTTRMDIHEVTRQLNSHLGPTLVATLAGIRDRKLPHRWAKEDGPEPRPEHQKRLRAAHRVWRLISATEGASVARSWFIGANPRLNELAPVIALREGDTAGVIFAATAFVEIS